LEFAIGIALHCETPQSIRQTGVDDRHCRFLKPMRQSSRKLMPIYTIAQYRVRPSGVEKVNRAIEEFVQYVQANEPGTKMYVAWRQQDDPTAFVHFFIFQDEAAHTLHSQSDAVKRFEAAYRPELTGGDVVFTDYHLVAANRPEYA
jgi:quinol monooxygenase YgiN